MENIVFPRYKEVLWGGLTILLIYIFFGVIGGFGVCVGVFFEFLLEYLLDFV